jgi:DNA replicative helicase MCM subunit Mcm2 (Cdc46/Mcm family)
MADKKIPADIRNWVSKQVENFQDSEGDMNSVFLSSVTGEVSEGSGYVIRLNISPMIKAKGDKTPTPSDRVIIEFAVGDGSRAAPCAIHNGSAKQLGGGWDDSEEFKSALDLLAQAQYDGTRLRIKGQYRTYKNKRLFIVDTIEKDEDSKKSKLSERQFNTFIRKCNKANLTPLEIMTQTLWEKFFAPEYIRKAVLLFCLSPYEKHELIHIGIITSHGEGKDTLVEKVIQPLVPCGVASSGQMTTIPGLVGAMSGDDLGSVDVGLLPKMNNERIALSEFQLWKDTVFGELLGAMANGFVQLTKGKLDIRKPTCVNILMLGNPPHHYSQDNSTKREMMEAFGRYTPQIVSRLTLIFTQLKLSQDDKQDFVDEIIIKNMDDYGSTVSDLKMWQSFFREYLRYVSRIPVSIYDSYGLIKSVFDTLKSKREFQEVFHARGLPDNRKWAEFANLCRSFARLNGRNQITNEDIRESYSAMLTSLQTLTTHFDLDDLALDLSPVMRNIYLETKEAGAIDTNTLGRKLRLKTKTVMSCLKELKEKGYVQQVGDVWVITSDEAPTNNSFKIETDKTEGWDIKDVPKGDGEISDELLEALESSEKN